MPTPTSVTYLTSVNYASYTNVTYEQVINALGYTPYDDTNPDAFISGIDSTMVTTALGYTPYNATNPSGFITSSALAPYLTSETASNTYYPLTNPSAFISGIDSLMVTTALGYTPYSDTNPSGFITSSALAPYLTSETASATYQVRGNYLTTISGLDISQLNNNSGYITSSALAPYLTSETASATYQVRGNYLTTISGLDISELNNDSGYITGITSDSVITALGYTPYNSTNPSGFITSSALTPYLTIETASNTYQPIGAYLTTISGLDISELNNNSGYITSSALAPYLTSETASATYQPRGNYLTTISGLDISQLNNNSGYITSSALEPYLTSATAQSTYVDFSTAQSLYNKTLYGSSYNSNIINMGSNYSLDITSGLYGVRIFTSADRTLFHEFDFRTDGVFTTPSDISIKGSVVFSGATTDSPKTILSVADYVQNATVTIPNETGTIALTRQLADYYPITNPNNYISGITSSDVTTALGYTPYSNANPSGFITSSALTPYLTTETASNTYQPIGAYLTTISGLDISELNNNSGYITSSALAPYLTSETASATYQVRGNYLTTISGLDISQLNNNSGYITSSALAPYLTSETASATYQVRGNYLTTISGLDISELNNDSGYITGITSDSVITALGYTPYSNANPSGFITSSALTPYLTSATASTTYQPIGNYLTTISGLDISELNNNSGYITSSALAPYLTSETASATYQLRGN